MAENDDPQEDLQVVAMTAGAAAARTAETLIRAAQNHEAGRATQPATPAARPLQPARDPEIVRARQVADAMNGRPSSEAARSKPVAQPARVVERIQVKEPERSR